MAPIFFERGIAKPETKVLSNLYFNLLILYFFILCLLAGKMQEDFFFFKSYTKENDQFN